MDLRPQSPHKPVPLSKGTLAQDFTHSGLSLLDTVFGRRGTKGTQTAGDIEMGTQELCVAVPELISDKMAPAACSLAPFLADLWGSCRGNGRLKNLEMNYTVILVTV